MSMGAATGRATARAIAVEVSLRMGPFFGR
jgi:hypothetical protein